MNNRTNILKDCGLFLLDMDGTLYLGDEVFPGAIEFIHTLQKTGRKYLYLTNNSSRSGAEYVNRLRALGFPCEEENVFTSGMATALYLNERHRGAAVYLVGTQAFAAELKNYGVRLAENAADVVVVGFDTELTFEKLKKAVGFLREGAAFIASNPDLVCPMPRNEVMPDCGSICALLKKATDRDPIFIGKPERKIVDIISEKTGVPNARICCVGDRLYTDIAVAINAGAVSACVLSGETTPEMLNSTPYVPDLVFRDIAELKEQFTAALECRSNNTDNHAWNDQ